jgi:N-acetylneuraminic acid mutarotase
MKRMIGMLLLSLVLNFQMCAPRPNNEEPPTEPSPWAWQRVPDFGGAAVTFSKAFVIDDRAYVGTGYGPTSAFWQYNPAANTWARKADFAGEPRGAAVAFAIDGKGYIGLGFGNLGQLSDLWEYDPATDRWTQKASIPGEARDHAGAFVVGQKAYIVGGTAGTDAQAVFLREVWEYNPQADAWLRRGDMPAEGLAEPASFVLNNRGYVGTGMFGNAASQVSKHFYQYDPENDSWVRKADFPGQARYVAVGFSLAGRGYIGTGMESYGETSSTVFRDIWEYDATADTWTARPGFSGPGRGAAAAFVLGAYVYIGTGTNRANQTLRDFWRARSEQ